MCKNSSTKRLTFRFNCVIDFISAQTRQELTHTHTHAIFQIQNFWLGTCYHKKKVFFTNASTPKSLGKEVCFCFKVFRAKRKKCSGTVVATDQARNKFWPAVKRHIRFWCAKDFLTQRHCQHLAPFVNRVQVKRKQTKHGPWEKRAPQCGCALKKVPPKKKDIEPTLFQKPCLLILSPVLRKWYQNER